MGNSYKSVHTFLITFIIVQQHWKCSCASIKMLVPRGAIAGPRILRKPDPPVLYYGDDVSEFLSICPNGCDKTCNLIELESNHCSTEDEKVVKDLKKAQKMVRDFQNALKDFTIDMIQWTWYGIILLMGLYLIIVKHFHFKTLLDSHYPDATDGMDLWQYERLKYVAVEVQQDQQSQDTTSTHIQEEDEETIQTEEDDDEKTLGKTFNVGNDDVNNEDEQMSIKKDNSKVHDSLRSYRKVSEVIPSNEPLLSRKDEITKHIQLNSEAKKLRREHKKKHKSLSKNNKTKSNLNRLKKKKSDKNIHNIEKSIEYSIRDSDITTKEQQPQEQQPSTSNSKPNSKEENNELEATILYPKRLLNPNEDDLHIKQYKL